MKTSRNRRILRNLRDGNGRSDGYSVLAMFIVAAIVIFVGVFMAVSLKNLIQRLDGRPSRSNTNSVDDISFPVGESTNVMVVMREFTYKWIDVPEWFTDEQVDEYLEDSLAGETYVGGPRESKPSVIIRLDMDTALDTRLEIVSTNGWIRTSLTNLITLDDDDFPVTWTSPEKVDIGIPVVLLRSTNFVDWAEITTLYLTPSPTNETKPVFFEDVNPPLPNVFYRTRR